MFRSVAFLMVLAVLSCHTGCSRTGHPIAASTPLESNLKALQRLVDERVAQLESANELGARGNESRVSEALREIMFDVTPAVNQLARDAAGSTVENDVKEVLADAERLAENSQRWNRSTADLLSGFNSLQNRLATVAEKAKAF